MLNKFYKMALNLKVIYRLALLRSKMICFSISSEYISQLLISGSQSWPAGFRIPVWVRVSRTPCNYWMSDKYLTWTLILLSLYGDDLYLWPQHFASINFLPLQKCPTCSWSSLTWGGSGLDINQGPCGHDTVFGIALTIFEFDHSITTSLFYHR